MYNRYQGNSGRVLRMDDGRRGPQPPRRDPPQAKQGGVQPKRQPRPIAAPPPGQRRPLSPLSGLSGELGRLLGKFSLSELDTEDILIILVLYLLYKDSGDEDFLIMMAGMFFL